MTPPLPEGSGWDREVRRFDADGGGTAPVACRVAAGAWAVRQGRFPR